MKKSISLLLPAVLGICIMLPAFAACDNPQLPADFNSATLTLSAGEYGTLEQTEYRVKVGEDLNEFLEDKAPVAEEGVIFGGWFDGETELAKDATMPEEGLSLTAHYKAYCDLSVYMYDAVLLEMQAANITAYVWLGETFTYNVPEGYILDETKESVTEMTVQKGENVLAVYLNRIYYAVTYHANAPAGLENAKDYSFKVYYGQTVYLQNYSHYSQEYRFLGWALEPDGEVVYDADFKLVLNNEVPYSSQSSFYRYLELYAKWEA